MERLHPLSGPLIDLRQVIHPLTQQGEDRIWRAAEKACKILDSAEDERNAMADRIEAQRQTIEGLRSALRGLLQSLDRDARGHILSDHELENAFEVARKALAAKDDGGRDGSGRDG